FYLLFLFIYFKIGNNLNTQNYKTIIFIILPFLIAIIFFTYNIYNINTLVGSFMEVYIQRLSTMKIIFPRFEPSGPFKHFIYFKPYDIFITNSFIVINLIPFLAFFKDIVWKHMKNNKSSNYLFFWFLYALFLYYYFSYGYIKGDSIRVLLPLSIPITLMIGKGAYNVMSGNYWPNWMNVMIYINFASMYLAYLYFFKLDNTKWWMINFNKLTNNLLNASYLEILCYTLPWIFVIIIKKINLNMSFLKRYLIIIFIITLSVVPASLFIQSLKYVNTYDPRYYDTAYSVENYANHWLIPVIEYYDSHMHDDVGVTIGFGVTSLKYFLKRSFIDLSHPRNWIIYLPLFQNMTGEEVLEYLDKFNIKFFLIPTKLYYTREIYEAALHYSTLFNLIEKNATITHDDSQIFKFKKIEELGAFNLYTIYCISS
ncbi:MAG: hypothetical protein ACFFDN_19220, partial [Candidatus Hodarchaeota archaeon]